MDYIRPLFALIRHLTLLVFSHFLAAAPKDYIRPLFALIRRQPLRPPSLSLENSLLALLPPEIIQHIASFLPPSAVASFASTCLPVRRTTGTQYLSALRASRDETIALLELLVTDLPIDPITGLPSRLLCVHCARLVPINVGCNPATPACAQACALSKEHIQASFCPPIFHTAMAMHRRGRSPDALLARLTSNTTTTHDSEDDTTTQKSWNYRIVCGSLYLRVREAGIFPSDNPNTYITRWRPCPHYRCYQDAMNVEAFAVQNEVRDGNRRSSSWPIQCPYCRTVIILGARKFRGRGLGLFITWWRDLGDGRAGDGKWAYQLRLLDEPEEWKEIPYDGYDIINGFYNYLPNYNRCYFDFEGVEARADRRELFKLSDWAIGSGK